MEDIQKHFMNKDTATKFVKSFWPEWNNALYSQLYRTYHPSYTNETLSSPGAMFVDATQIVREAVAEGKKLGLLNFIDSWLAYSIEFKTAGRLQLNWVEATLLYRVLEYIIDEFRHYCGENGIDPTGRGKCLDDFPHLREDYLALRERILNLKDMGLPVENLLEQGQLELIPLTPKITTESVMKTLMESNPKWWKEVGVNLLKENKEEKNNIRAVILKETSKLVINKTLITEHKPLLNPEVVEGDVIELIYMDDPWHPIPIATRGIVMGFDSVGTIGEKILVKWIINSEEGNEEFKNTPLLPDVDVWRMVNMPLPLDEQQEIQYDTVITPKKYGNKEYVYFKGTDAIKSPDAEKIILSGPNGDITLDSIEVKNAKFGGLQVNYNRETQQGLDRLFNYVDLTKECEFLNQTLRDGRWAKGGEYRNRTFGKIQQSLKEIYRNNIAGKNEPSPLHISNGFINIPGTEAEGTTHGWSIINFFNTNPVVRRILVEEYQSFVRENKLPCTFNIYEFTDWLGNNKNDIFGFDSTVFNRLVKANQSSWKNGKKNETDVLGPLQKLYGDEWSVIYDGEPGIRADALGGVDMSVVNNQTGEEHSIQAKPLSKVEEKDGTWIVHSGWLHEYPRTVTHFVFGPDSTGDIVVFKNEGQIPIDGGSKYVFNYPPL